MAIRGSEDGRYFAADAEAADELARLRILEAICDPQTFQVLDTIGVEPGWRCLEVGAGAGSVTRWLADKVGLRGRVVAADLDTRFIDDVGLPNVEARHCNIADDEIEPAAYDLVHSRAVVMHMDDPLDVLRRMTAALRPGGWLVIEDPDYGTVEAIDRSHPLVAPFEQCYQARIQYLVEAKVMDLRYGRTLPIHLDALGLVDKDNAASTKFAHGGEPMSMFWAQTWQHTDGAMIASGAITEAQADDARRALDDPTFLYRAALMQSVWGRKPDLTPGRQAPTAAE